MSRTEKLFHRLDELEAEYLHIVADHFSAWLLGQRWNRFLIRIYNGDGVWGKYHIDEQYDHIARLETEIETLRAKLDQPPERSPVVAISNLFEKIRVSNSNGSGDEFPLVKEFLKHWSAPPDDVVQRKTRE